MDASIVIASRNRRDLLGRTLRSLMDTKVAATFEVVVVDHGSTDGTAELVDGVTTLPIRRIDAAFRGESIAEPKNEGIAAARGDLVVFLDSGMIAPRHFLSAHLAAHASNPGSFVAGGVVGWDIESDEDPFWRAVDRDGAAAAVPDRLADPRRVRWDSCADTTWMLVWGANMSVPRRALSDHGGFDETMTGWGWDDVELAFRLARGGFAPTYEPEAWAVHYPHPRRPMAERMSTADVNWLRAYNRHRSPELEMWRSCQYWEHTNCLRRLRAVTDRAMAGLTPAPPGPPGSSRVLFGFAADCRDPNDTYIAWPGAPVVGDRIVRSFGVRTWLPTAQAEFSVTSPSILAFDWSGGPGWPTFAQRILRELARVSTKVRVAGSGRLSRAERDRLCELSVEAGVSDFGFLEGG